LALRPRPARAAVPVMRLGNAAGIIDAQLAFTTCGQHPKLGYYKEEGLDIEVLNMSSSSQALQAVATGSADFSALSPPTLLPVYATTPSLNIISAYVWLRQAHWQVTVKPDSPITSVADLKGKRIGIRNPGDTGFFGAKAMFRELGFDPAKDAEWISVGAGGPAGQALYGDRIDALAIWDGELARVELAGFPLRYLSNTPGMQNLFGSALCVGRSALQANRDRFVRVFRANAKSTVFTYANPELAVRMHWQLYPEGKPKGKSEEEAMREALYILKVRKDKWFAAPWQADKRMGASTAEEWQAQVRFVELQDKIQDVAPLFTNDLLDEINDFDRAVIEEQARTIRL
jgi:NitT/TauT family transport system substrate-binding protein